MKVLITGASSGIGRDMARYLASLGHDLVIVAREREPLEELKKELKVKTSIITADISKEENCFKIFEQEKDIDILINNAGFGIFGEFYKTDLQKDLNLINTNIVGLHILTKLYLQEMVKKDKGYILNVASIAGFMPAGGLMSTYYASKAYVRSLTMGVNKELKKIKSNVKISVLCPGPVKTNFNNVAKVQFATKSLTSDYVAKYAINKMFNNKLVIIPGFKIKLAKLGSKIAPDALVTEIAYNIQKAKK